MMKSVFLFSILILGIGFNLYAQDEEEYYKPPSKREDVKNNSYPNLDRKSMSLYLGLEGGFKLNYTSLSNTIGNLINSQNNNEFFWGANIGYNLDNRWAFETGYMQNPIYYVQVIAAGRGVPFTYRIGQNLKMVPVRAKYKVLNVDGITKTAALFVGAGVLIGMNTSDKAIFSREFNGYNGNPANKNTIKLTTDSYLSKKGRAIFEAQTELQGKVTNGFYISLFGRMNFGANGIIRSDVAYFQNSNKIEAATQLLKGISYNFGLLLRFDLARGYKYQSKVE
jgi:hypothetical protein